MLIIYISNCMFIKYIINENEWHYFLRVIGLKFLRLLGSFLEYKYLTCISFINFIVCISLKVLHFMYLFANLRVVNDTL